jgi:hypothetical protein
LEEGVNEAGWNLFKYNWARFKRTYLPNHTDEDQGQAALLLLQQARRGHSQH